MSPALWLSFHNFQRTDLTTSVLLFLPLGWDWFNQQHWTFLYNTASTTAAFPRILKKKEGDEVVVLRKRKQPFTAHYLLNLFWQRVWALVFRHLWLLGVLMDPATSLLWWPSFLEHQPGLHSHLCRNHWAVLELQSLEGRLKLLGALMVKRFTLMWVLEFASTFSYGCLIGAGVLARALKPVEDSWSNGSKEIFACCPFNSLRASAMPKPMHTRLSWNYSITNRHIRGLSAYFTPFAQTFIW